MSREISAGVLIFPDVDVLDFAGPYEVLSIARLDESRRRETTSPFRVHLIAESTAPVRASGGLRVLPDFTLEDCPELDLLIVPGGWGTRREMNNEKLTSWIARHAARGLTASVCTGALLLGRAGLLRGIDATTHWRSLEWMQELFADTRVRSDLHFTMEGRVFTSAGISAGIDLSIRIVQHYFGEDMARRTARHMEYPFPESDRRRIVL